MPNLLRMRIKILVVEDKWFASIRAAIEGEVEQLIQRFARRMKETEQALRPAATGTEAGSGCIQCEG